MYENQDPRSRRPDGWVRDDRVHVVRLLDRLIESLQGDELVVVEVQDDGVGPMGGSYSKLTVVYKRDDDTWGGAICNIYDLAQCGVDIEELLQRQVEEKAKAGRIEELVEQIRATAAGEG